MDTNARRDQAILNWLNEKLCGGVLEAFWNRIRRMIMEYLRPSSRSQAAPTDEELLQQAHRELLEAHNRFSSIEEPELIDCAIYSLKAAEIRYDYLFRRIKQQRAVRC